jgi:muramidase (phage lysozyme)
MSGSGSNVIREFLVRVGYEEKGREQITKSLGSITGQAAELALAFKGAASSIQDAVGIMASNLEQIYFLSQRSNATAESIKAIGFAAAQVGSSVDAARTSLDNLGRVLWSNPAGESFLQSLGVQTRDANGKLIETGKLFDDLLRAARTRPPAVQLGIASFFGIDVNLLRASGAEFEKEEARHRKILAAAHIDTKRATEDSHFLGVEWRSLGAAVGALGDKIASSFSRESGEQINRFTTWLTNNFDTIVAVIEWAVDSVIKFGRVFEEFGRGLWQFAVDAKNAWDKLDDDSKGLLATFAAITLGLWALSLAFALSPVGRVLALGAAFVTLYTDYQQWKQGAESPIDWEKWKPSIDAAEAGFKRIGKSLLHLLDVLENKLWPAFKKVLGGEGLSGQDFLAVQLEKFAKDIEHFIDDISDSFEIIAAIATGDLTGAWKLWQDRRARNRIIPELSPNEVGGTPERDESGEVLRQPGEDDATFFRRRGRERVGQWRFFGAAADATRVLLSRAGVRFGAEGPVQGGSGASAEPGPEDAYLKPVLDLLGKAEGTDRGRGYNETLAYGKWTGGPVDLTKMTLDQVSALQDRMLAAQAAAGISADVRSSAVGRYQFIQSTLGPLARKYGIRGDALFDEKMQDHLAALRIREGGGLTQDVLAGGWASIPDPGTGRSHYGGQGAHATDAEVQAAIAQANALRAGPPVVGPGGIARPRISATRADPRLEPAPTVTPGVGATGAPGVGPLVGPQSRIISNDNSRQLALNQENNITVHVANTDGYAIGRSVLEAQRTLSQQMARDAASRVG